LLVLDREPANERARQNLTLCREKIREARKPSPALLQAIVLHMEGKIGEAIAELERALGGGEKQLDALSALGHLDYESARFAAAAGVYGRVLEREPKHRSCHYNLAVCLEKLGEYGEALREFETAAEINPARAEIKIGAGVSLLRLGRFADAVAA